MGWGGLTEGRAGVRGMGGEQGEPLLPGAARPCVALRHSAWRCSCRVLQYSFYCFLVVQSDSDFDSGHVLIHKAHPSELIVSEVESKAARVILHKRHPKEMVMNGDFVFSR